MFGRRRKRKNGIDAVRKEPVCLRTKHKSVVLTEETRVDVWPNVSLSFFVFCINSSHHLNTLVIIYVPVDTASPSLLYL